MANQSLASTPKDLPSLVWSLRHGPLGFRSVVVGRANPEYRGENDCSQFDPFSVTIHTGHAHRGRDDSRKERTFQTRSRRKVRVGVSAVMA